MHMLFHNVLDYKLWAFEHLWAPGALKTVEERATLHSHVVPFGDAALTVGSHTSMPLLSHSSLNSTILLYNYPWGFLGGRTGRGSRSDAQRRRGRGSRSRSLFRGRGDPSRPRRLVQAREGCRGSHSRLPLPINVHGTTTDRLVGPRTASTGLRLNRGPSTQCFARSGRDGRRLKRRACRGSSRSRRLLPPSQALFAPQSPARSRGRGRRGLAGRRALLRSKRRRRTQPSLNRARCHKRRRLVQETDPDAPGQFEDGASEGATSFPRASR